MSNAPLTAADVEQRTRTVFEVWNTLDTERISQSYSGGFGFGYRTRPPRPPLAKKEDYRKSLEFWLESLVYYRIAIDELHTLADGDIGVAWGYYREELQYHGRAPEVMRGRFSEVMKRDPTGWSTLFYHRDMTPFDDKGAYVPPPTP